MRILLSGWDWRSTYPFCYLGVETLCKKKTKIYQSIWLKKYVGLCPFFTIFISVKIASQDYYKKSVQSLKNHQLAAETIGKPLRIPYVNLARKDIKIDHKTAQASRSSFNESTYMYLLHYLFLKKLQNLFFQTFDFLTSQGLEPEEQEEASCIKKCNLDWN